jgi:hypothetical protein
MSDQDDDHYEHLEEMGLVQTSLDELKAEVELLTDMTAEAQRLAINKGLEVERLKKQLEKCKEIVLGAKFELELAGKWNASDACNRRLAELEEIE